MFANFLNNYFQEINLLETKEQL